MSPFDPRKHQGRSTFSRQRVDPLQVELDCTSPRHLASSLRSRLVGLLPPSETYTRAVLEEAALVLDAGSTRAAMVFIWSAGVEAVARRLSAHGAPGWTAIVARARARPASDKAAAKANVKPASIPQPPHGFIIGEWAAHYTDAHVVYLGFVEDLYSMDAVERLFRDCFRLRCVSAHPSGTGVSTEDVARAMRLVACHMLPVGA